MSAAIEMQGAAGSRKGGKAWPKGSEAQEAAKAQALAFLRKDRKGKPTHNHDLCRAMGISIDAKGAGRLYSALKADERFIFQPEGLPASFAPAKAKRAAKASS